MLAQVALLAAGTGIDSPLEERLLLLQVRGPGGQEGRLAGLLPKAVGALLAGAAAITAAAVGRQRVPADQTLSGGQRPLDGGVSRAYHHGIVTHGDSGPSPVLLEVTTPRERSRSPRRYPTLTANSKLSIAWGES